MSPTGRTSYVIDTCVLLADPHALYRFDEHEVVVPLVVVEELDRNKTRMDEVGRNARTALRVIEELRERSGSGLREPIELGRGGTLRVEGNHVGGSSGADGSSVGGSSGADGSSVGGSSGADGSSGVDTQLPSYLDPAKPDHRILAVALALRGTLVTKDSALRIKGSQLGCAVDDYRADTVHVDEHYTGIGEVGVDSETLSHLHRDGKITLAREVMGGAALWRNQCLVLRAGRSSSGLGRVVDVDAEGAATVDRVPGTPRAFGVSPRDVRQTFALDLLTDPAVPCVSLMGMAGTGKTFLALAAGLEQVVEAHAYRRLSVYRPLVPVGRQEVGYLPGDLDEKLSPWMAAVNDNLYSLFRRDSVADAAGALGRRDDHRDAQAAVDALLDRGQLEMAAITYLRGRSITDEFVIVDEAQNLELPTLKVILTRMASGSKLVFCGDLSQVDNPYISPYGGMAALIEKLKGTALFGHVALHKGVRSPLAELAATTF